MSYDYVLADDLSGALEAGAAFRARGRRVVLQLDGFGQTTEDTLALHSSETRNVTGRIAADGVRRILIHQRLAGANLLLKKSIRRSAVRWARRSLQLGRSSRRR